MPAPFLHTVRAFPLVGAAKPHTAIERNLYTKSIRLVPTYRLRFVPDVPM